MKKLYIGVLIVWMTLFGITGCFEILPESDSVKENTNSSYSISMENDDKETVESLDTNNQQTSDTGEGENSDITSDANDSSNNENNNTENAPPSGTVVPPITDGGNFDGTV